MSPLKGIRITLIAALIIACAAVTERAQEFRGSITGRVVDNSGAAVANAVVTVTNIATNGVIPAGGSMDGIGFNAQWDNVINAKPPNFRVNNLRCATG